MEAHTTMSVPDSPRINSFYVDGQWQTSGEREQFSISAPGYGTVVSITPKCTENDLNNAVSAARVAFDDGRWSSLLGLQRSELLLKAADLVRQRTDEIAYWETLESGKPISQSRAEVSGCVTMFEYGAGAARMLHGDSFNNLGDSMFGMVLREPIGVVGVITPWNFPFLILCERIPFILASGCTIVSKPSEVTSTSTLLLAEILAEAGLPDGCFNVVTGSGQQIGSKLAEHKDVDMLSFTGSTQVGRQCLHAAQSNFKKLGLELGGKNPQIVFADADLDAAADGVVFGSCFNAGQCCVSGSRLLVEESVATQFERLVKDKFAQVKIGDLLDPKTQLSAIVTDVQHDSIMAHIKQAQADGARLVCGGESFVLDGGRFIQPTLFTNVSNTMVVQTEEIFGPVLTLSTFNSVNQAIDMANDTIYGLAASVWSSNLNTAMQVTRKVKAGRFWVNTTISGGCELPIGGFKQSGWGREAGVYGVEEYTQIKSVHIEIGERQKWICS